jgi:hypothetical protein
MDYLKNTIERFSVSSFSVVLIGVIIITSNLVWFLPTMSSLRNSIGDVEKATVKIALTEIESFLDAKEHEVMVPMRFILEDLHDLENALLIQKILKEKHFISVALSDKDGNEIFKYDKFKTVFPEELRNVLDRQDFRGVLRTGELSWSDVAVSEKFEPVITFSVPLFSVKGELIGVVSATINVSPVFIALADIDINQGKTYVVDNNGALISDPDLSLVLRGVNYFDRRIVKDALLGSDVIVSAYDDTYSYVNDQKVKVLAVAAKILKTNWVVVFEEPRSVALQNMTKLIIFAFGSFMVVSFLIFLMQRINLKVLLGRKELEKNLLVQIGLFQKVEVSKKEIEVINDHLKEKDSRLAEKVAELESFQKFVVDREIRMIELKQEITALKKTAENLPLKS